VAPRVGGLQPGRQLHERQAGATRLDAGQQGIGGILEFRLHREDGAGEAQHHEHRRQEAADDEVREEQGPAKGHA
jgi:hypothetical protein